MASIGGFRFALPSFYIVPAKRGWSNVRKSQHRTLDLHCPMPNPPSEIFLIHDDSDVRLVSVTYLKRAFPDARIAEFVTAESALRGLQDCPPDAIVTDYLLPQMRGTEFVRRIRV